MITVNPTILAEIKKYDSKLFVKWNNKDQHFEIWRQMFWGDRLVTPVVESIYGGRNYNFCPLDMRIMAWLYSADTQRKGLNKNWKWKRDKRFKEIDAVNSRKAKRLFSDIAKDNYMSVQGELLGLSSNEQEDKWCRPDIETRNGTLLRSGDNVNECYGDIDDSVRGDR